MTTVAAGLEADLVTAAGTMSPAPVVRAGEPALPGSPLLAYWFLGLPVWESDTLTETQRISRWGIRLYWPMAPVIAADADQGVEQWLEAGAIAVETAIYADVSLGGACTGGALELSDARAGWISDESGAKYRVVEWELGAYLSNVSLIKR